MRPKMPQATRRRRERQQLETGKRTRVRACETEKERETEKQRERASTAVVAHLLNKACIDEGLDDDVEALRVRPQAEVDHAGQQFRRLLQERFCRVMDGWRIRIRRSATHTNLGGGG